MKKSIKLKITIIFIIVFVCCILSILIFNTLFLEKLYINEKKDILKITYETIDRGVATAYENGYDLSDLFSQNNKRKANVDREESDGSRYSIFNTTSETNLMKFLRELQENFNVNVVLMDKDNKVYSLYQNTKRFDRRIMYYVFGNNLENSNIEILEKNDKFTIAINTPPQEDIFIRPKGTADGGPTEYVENEGPSATNKKEWTRPNFFAPTNKNSDIECFGFLSDKSTAFFMTIPVGSIKEPIKLFNNVLIIISICVSILGSFVIYLTVKKTTRPILELSDLSLKMSRLEFENRYEGDRQDELGILGKSMNEMSDKLERAIKELKNANVKLKEDLEQKEQLDLMRQEFVANVSHELKTPISLIEGYAEGLEIDSIVEDKEQREYYVHVIEDEALKMNKLVRQLLDLSAIERGMSNLEIERINLGELVKGVVKSEEIVISEKNVDVKVTIPNNLFVWADEFKTEEVIKNYLTNALNHVDDNKIIKIWSENIENDKIRLFVYNSGNSLNEEERQKIWEKFYKVDKARTRAYGGTGLGLSIVKAIAEQHNTECGCIGVMEDKENKEGIAFYFDFSIK